MMEHVRQFDWCASIPERYFVEETDIDNCSTEKILRNKFCDPLLSSESENEDTHNNINWDKIFQNKLNFKNKMFVPCMRGIPPYPKLSALTAKQHVQFLRILSEENPGVLEDLSLGKPMEQDYKAFEAMKETYQKEQKEYIAWAKVLWSTDQCVRALRPRPGVEATYDALHKLRAHRLRAAPPHYGVAAHIPLHCRTTHCQLVLVNELINVSLQDMPLAQIPYKIEQQFSIIRPCTVPEPCQKHPYQIILPNEESVSVLPITEIHRELAIYALSQGAQHIASENALKCLMQQDRTWMIPLSVCETIAPDGERVNVLVLDSEFSVHKEAAPVRTLKAFRYLLEHALIPPAERERVWQRLKNCKKKGMSSPRVNNVSTVEDNDMSSDDDHNGLVMDIGSDNEEKDDEALFQPSKKSKIEDKSSGKSTSGRIMTRAARRRLSEDVDIDGYTCSCKDTLLEKPPRRSFKKWQLRNKQNNENYDIIIHCPHKARDKSSELVIEAIPEYQIDLGASKQSADSIRSLALSLALRKKASVLNVRVDGSVGDVASFELLSSEQFHDKYPQVGKLVPDTLHTALSQLQGLLPGHYVLQHEASHGSNALLLSPRAAPTHLSLQLNAAPLADCDEAKLAKIPPTLTTDLLPFHKHRRILPCAFTPYENQLMKEPKKPAPKKKAPPQAIKWPKKHSHKKKNW